MKAKKERQNEGRPQRENKQDKTIKRDSIMSSDCTPTFQKNVQPSGLT
jgi:hypothetical protein